MNGVVRTIQPNTRVLAVRIETPDYSTISGDGLYAREYMSKPSDLKQLATLYPNVDEMEIYNVTDDHFRHIPFHKFKQLKRLRLDGTLEKNRAYVMISRIPQLRKLVWKNKIWSDVIVKHLATQDFLHALTIDSHMTDAQAQMFLQNRALTIFDLDDNKWITPLTRQQLQQRMDENKNQLAVLTETAPIVAAMRTKSPISRSIFDINSIIQSYVNPKVLSKT